MSHLLKFTVWEQNGKWHCNDVSDLGHGSGYWWHPARMLGISLTDYVLLLKDEFHAVNFSFPNQKILLWDWQSYMLMGYSSAGLEHRSYKPGLSRVRIPLSLFITMKKISTNYLSPLGIQKQRRNKMKKLIIMVTVILSIICMFTIGTYTTFAR